LSHEWPHRLQSQIRGISSAASPFGGYRTDQAGDQGKPFLAANDDVQGNGSGAFTWLIQEYR
jgi:hypothetical protein